MSRQDITAVPSRYTFNALPEAARVADWHVWHVYAEQSVDGRWYARSINGWYDTTGRVHATAVEAGGMSVTEALAVAEGAARYMTVGGMTIRKHCERIAALSRTEQPAGGDYLAQLARYREQADRRIRDLEGLLRAAEDELQKLRAPKPVEDVC